MFKIHSIKRIFGVLAFIVLFIFTFGSDFSETYKDDSLTGVKENDSAIVYCEYCDPLERVLPADGFNERPLMGEHNGRSDSDWTITAGFSDSGTRCPHHSTDVLWLPYCEHTGQDWALNGASALEADIYAEANGTVVAKAYDGGFGNYVMIKHNDQLNFFETDVWSQYGHLDDPSILNVGDQVYRGQVIGYVGNSGAGSFGPHLHLEIRLEDFSATMWPYSNSSTPDFPKHSSATFCTDARNYLINMGYRVPNAFVSERLFSNRSGRVTPLMEGYQNMGIINEQFNRYYIEKRAYFITILIRTLELFYGHTLPEAEDPFFTDINNIDVELQSAIRKGLELGIISTANTEFRPLDPIQRIEALAFIVRAYEQLELEEGEEIEFQEEPYFDDIQIVNEGNNQRWIWETAQKGREAMLVSGYVVNENRYMCPLRWTTREEAVILVNNLMTHLASESVPVINWFRINNGSPTATSCDVTLNNDVTGAGEGTVYMASEDPDFWGAEWHPYDSAPTFSINPVDGVKTIYFKVRNHSNVESQVAIDSIIIVLNNDAPIITRFEIENGVEQTTDRRVILNNDVAGEAVEYMASLNSQFKDAEWLDYNQEPTFLIERGFGANRIYFKVRNSAGVESEVVSDGIKISQNYTPFITRLKINNGADTTDKLIVRLNNTATRNPDDYMASEGPEFEGAEWKKYTHTPEFILSEGNGLKKVFFKVRKGDLEAAYVSDTIMLEMDETLRVISFTIENGAESTNKQEITIKNKAKGSPTHFKVSEDKNFKRSGWKRYSEKATYKLSKKKGLKTLYFKVKRKKDESDPVKASITLK